MSVEKGYRPNNIILDLEFSANDGKMVEIVVAHDKIVMEEQLCLYDIICDSITIQSVDDLIDPVEITDFAKQYKYDAVVNYKCDRGQGFK